MEQNAGDGILFLLRFKFAFKLNKNGRWTQKVSRYI